MALQLAVGAALTGPLDWAEKFYAVAQAIHALVPWDICSISIPQKPGLGLTWHRAPDDSTYPVTPAQVLHDLGVSLPELQALALATLPLHRQPAIYAGADFAALRAGYELVERTHRAWNIHAKLYLPVLFDGELSVLFILASHQPGAYQPTHLALLQRLAPLLGLALKNLLAYEALQRHEREKSLFIAVTTALTVRPTWEEKFAAMTELVSEAVPMDLFSVSFDAPDYPRAYSFERTAAGAWVPVRWEDYQQKLHLSQAELLRHRTAFQVHCSAASLHTGEAHRALAARHYLEGVVREHYGIRSSLVVPLDIDAAPSGKCCLLVGHRAPEGLTPAHLALLEQLAPQVALVLEKLLAYEGSQQRAQEQTLQVDLALALARDVSLSAKFAAIAALFQPLVPFDFLLLGLRATATAAGERGGLIERTGPDEYRPLDLGALGTITGLTAAELEQLRRETAYPAPQLLAGDDLTAALRTTPLLGRAARALRVQAQLAVPLPLGAAGRLLLAFCSRAPHAYRPEHLALVRRVAPTLQASLEKLLAYEEIGRLNERLRQENRDLAEEARTPYRFDEIIGQSPALLQLLAQVRLVAPTDTTVLIQGETGTGKELLARAVHDLSPRRGRALIKLNCAALPAQLIESELFGHEKGAFTGAVERRIGKFELADGGTLFLDEIGELPLELQVKLLRAIQEREVERLGSNKVLKVDVRLLAATNRQLEKEVAAGRFRADLYFRLNVFPLTLPPLRERPDDLPLLARHLLAKLAKRLGRPVPHLAPAAAAAMARYPWPGNVRELEHVLERALITAGPGPLAVLNLPPLAPTGPVAAPGAIPTLADNERDLILRALAQCKGRIRGPGGAARLLDIQPNTLDARMKKLGIARQSTFGAE